MSREDFITTPENFIAKISFQLYEIYDGQETHPVSNSWRKVTEELMSRDDFGKGLEERGAWAGEAVKVLVAKKPGKLAEAQSIFEYLRDNFTCTSHNNKFIKTSLQDVYRKKSGNVGEINLLLTALLREDGIDAYPVLLSTREYGRNSATYPMLDKLNYLVCKMVIEGKDYYLDASEPLLGFNKLPLSCYNGHARIINRDTAMAVQFMADSVKEREAISVIIANTDAGIAGSYTLTPGYYRSVKLRTGLISGSMDAFSRQIQALYPREFAVNGVEVDSLKNLEQPLLIRYKMQIKLPEDDVVYFNPLLGKNAGNNPFVASSRIYPVEMQFGLDESYTLNMEVPKGYVVEELPKSIVVRLNNNGGSFEYIISQSNGIIEMKRSLKLNRANFTTRDYQDLREFYAQVIKKEAEQIVFKKARS